MPSDKPWTDDDKAMFRRLWSQGSNLKVIAHELDRSYASVKGYRKVMGLPPRRKPGVEGEKRNVEHRVYLSRKVSSRLGSRSMQAGRSISDYIRSLIMRDLGL
jgi:hypothetical protein